MRWKEIFFDNISIKQTVLKNTFWLYFTELVSRTPMFILSILIARYLGVEGYGVFSFVFAFVSLFSVLADFGLGSLTIREVARDRTLAEKYLNNIVILKVILGVITFGLIIITIQFFGRTPQTRTLVFLAAIWVFIQSFVQFFQSIFRSFEKMQYEAITRTTYSLVLLIIAFFVVWKDLGIVFLVQGYIYASLIAFSLSFFVLKKRFVLAPLNLEINFGFWRKILEASWPFAFTAIFYIVNLKISTVFLSILRTDAEVGWYNVAYTLLLNVLLLPQALTEAIYPTMSKLYKDSPRSLFLLTQKTVQILSLSAFLIGLFLILFSREIIIVLYGVNYLQSVNVFRILMFGIMAGFLSIPLSALLEAINRQKRVTYIRAWSVTINIALNLVFIPKFGYIGAAFAMVVTEFVFLSLTGFYAREYFLRSRGK